MATILVGQASRDHVRRVLKEAKVPITREGYSDSSTTTWAFVVRTRKTPRQLQNIVWDSGVQWCDVKRENASGVGRYW